jgi:ABC-2 type transport system permease protein
VTALAVNQFRATCAIVRRDWAVFSSYRFRLLGQTFAAVSLIVMFRFTSKLVHVPMFRSTDQYFGFAVVGIVTLQVLTSTLTTPPGSVRQELVAGTFERLVLSPFGPVMSTLAMMIFPLLYVLVVGAFTLLIGVAFGMSISWQTAPLAIPVAVLGAVTFMPFGVLFAALTLAFKQALNATTYVLAGIGLIAGFYFPVSLLPHWIQWTSDVQPFTPSVDLIRHLLVGTTLRESAWLELLKLIGFTLLLLPVSVAALTYAIETSRRRGTITEY